MALKKVSIGLNQSKEILYPNVIYIELFMLILDQKKTHVQFYEGLKNSWLYKLFYLSLYFWNS